MDIRKTIKRCLAIGASVFTVAVAAQFFVSCGNDYEKPSTTQTDSALISAATLSSWMEAGKVNGTGYDRVVILDVTDSSSYGSGHIPGALFLSNGEIAQDRNEGVGTSVYEVLDGPTMDGLVQKYGIDGNTTVVLTSSLSKAPLYNVARVYFTFRYWGFSRNRLKVLNGLNSAWPAGELTSQAPPAVAKSTYSVRDNPGLRNDLRVSLAEMIDYAEGRTPDAVAIDVRGATKSYGGVPGSTGGPFSTTGKSDKTVFEGRIKGGKAIVGGSLFSGSTFKPVGDLVAAFTNVGVDSTKTAYVYCVKGYSSAAAFFVLDGILGWPAAIYDGSWTQWGQLSGNAAMKGQLDANSPWRTDIPSRSDLIVYNFESLISAVTATAAQNDLTTSGTFAGGSDAAFVITIDSAGTGTTPDTFTWSSDGGTNWAGAAVPVTGSAQLLENGVSITFGSSTGHAVGDSWTFTATARQNVEQFTADGNVCSATFNADGTITNSSGGSTACTNLPDSFDTEANRVEEEDRAYMDSGGSGGTTGGNTSVPAGC